MKPLEIRNLSVEYLTAGGLIRVVDDVSIDISERGEILAIVGESGCGKSTLGLAIAGLLPSNARIAGGQIKIFGKDVATNKVRVAVIFQDALASLNPLLTVGEQIAEIYEHHFRMTKKEALEEAKKRLKDVGLPPSLMDRYPHEISGGQRQRALIAMTIAMEPELIVADEPTTALDVTIQAKVLILLRDIVKRYGVPMVYITHDLSLASQIADSIAVMYAGQIVESSDKFSIFKEPRHPYTQALLKSIPRIDIDVDELYIIRGEPPLPGSFPKGCRFNPRCPVAFKNCFYEEPALKMVDGGYVRCHLYG
ncbi:MAG: ABC transporter ATP-binding protein [Ignisphaera sp.]|nr:ABC transporter ATP-binding protein [Ignisphaera sp.]MDW8085700.1 ABC transporter ATP-binding protein [Ignisphaera sp.]